MLNAMGFGRGWMVRVAGVVVLTASAALTGCGTFFPAETGGGGGTTCTDCVYTALGDTSLGLKGYSVSSTGTLTAAGSTTTLVGAATSLAVSPVAPYLYVGSLEGEFILVYTINSDGSLTAAASGQSIVTALTPTAMAVDPTGNYLVAISQGVTCSNNTGQTCFALTSIPISTSTGAANGSVTQVTLAVNGTGLGVACSSTGSCNQIVFSGTTMYVAAGNGGLYSYTFSNGTIGSTPQATLIPSSTTTSVNSVATNGTYIFAGVSGANGGLYGFNSSGNTALPSSPYTTGDTSGHSEWAVVMSGSQYVYVTNAASGTVTGYAQSSLTGATSSTPAALTGSPYTVSTGSGTYNTVGLVLDETGKYVIAMSAGGSSDLTAFAIGSDGSLGTPTAQINVGSSGSGTPQAIAATTSGT